MDIVLKTVSGTLLTVILILAVEKQDRGIAAILSITACAMVAVVILSSLRPIIDLMITINSVGNLQENGLELLIKITGIGLIAEIASVVCQDTGNASLGKELQLLASVVILNLSLPFFESLLNLVQGILGEI